MSNAARIQSAEQRIRRAKSAIAHARIAIPAHVAKYEDELASAERILAKLKYS